MAWAGYACSLSPSLLAAATWIRGSQSTFAVVARRAAVVAANAACLAVCLERRPRRSQRRVQRTTKTAIAAPICWRASRQMHRWRAFNHPAACCLPGANRGSIVLWRSRRFRPATSASTPSLTAALPVCAHLLRSFIHQANPVRFLLSNRPRVTRWLAALAGPHLLRDRK